MNRRIVTGIKLFSGKRRGKQDKKKETKRRELMEGKEERCKTRESGRMKLILKKEKRNRKEGVGKFRQVHAIVTMFGWGKK